MPTTTPATKTTRKERVLARLSRPMWRSTVVDFIVGSRNDAVWTGQLGGGSLVRWFAGGG